MIDIGKEELIPVRDLPGRFPPRPNKNRIHLSSFYRWITRGVRGGIVLESIKLGGTTYVSAQALERFAERLSAATNQTPRKADTPRTRRREIDRAARRVADMLGGGSDDE